ncbi:hypothetical protein Gohar_028417, partial [Gossypium harknessii]|nr:hypothetical protein [Gossypium harknessii]
FERFDISSHIASYKSVDFTLLSGSEKLFLREYLNRELIFLDKVEDNVAVRIWSEKIHIGIPPTVALPLGKFIWYLPWKSTRPYFVARRFKLTKPIREPPISRYS